MRTRHLVHIGLLFLFIAGPIGIGAVPHVGWAQERNASDRHLSDPFASEEQMHPKKHLQSPVQPPTAHPTKSLPSDVEVIDPVQTFFFDHNPDDQFNFDFTGIAEYAGDINGDGIDDYIRVDGARDERTDDLEDSVYKTAVFFGGTPAPSTPDQMLYKGILPVGDLNGDGMADAIVRTEEGVHIYTGSSSGYEDSSIEIDTKSLPSHPRSVRRFMGGAADFDGDGFDDVLIGTQSEGFDIVYGNADLTDVEVQSYLLDEYDHLYNAADLDGDGTAEIVRLTAEIGEAGRYFSVGRIEDRQEFVEIQRFALDNIYSYPASLWLVDITGDGALDLVVSDHFPGLITMTSEVYLQESTLSFSETSITFGKGALPAGDLNGDGRHDFYTRKQNEETSQYEYYISYGPSDPADGLSYDVAIPTHTKEVFKPIRTQHAGRLGDITDDGRDDAMLGIRNHADRTIERRIVSVDESGDLETIDVTYPMGEFYNRIVATHNAGDLNGDGIDDIAMMNLDLGEVYLFYGGLTIASEPDATLHSDEACFPYNAAGGDFNGDGHNDLAVVFRGINRASSQIAIYLGENPSGTPDHVIAFDEVAPADYSDGFAQLTASDIDGDGDDDLLVTSSNRLGRIQATFVFSGGSPLPHTPDWVIDDYTPQPWNPAFNESIVDLGDVNGDGVHDVAIGVPQLGNGNDPAGAVHVYYGQSETGPDFSSPDQELVPPSSGSESYEGFGYGLAGGGDFNGDGFHDVAVAPARRRDEESRTVHLFFGSEDGFGDTADIRLRAPVELFGPNARDYMDDGYLVENQPHLRFIPDVDGDGDDELLMTSGPRGATNAVVYLGGSEDDADPKAVFRAPNQRTHLGGEYGVAIGDFTGNGSPDYVLAQFGDNNDAALSSRVYRYAASALPVELASFRATADGPDTATLRWATASETQNAGFRVQHRRPDQPFTELAFVEGAGTTQRPQSYRYTAEGLAPGQHVFRLEQVDRNGTTEHSSEVEVELAIASTYTLSATYPNPFRTQARLQLTVREAQDVTITVHDALGRRVQTLYDGRIGANAPQDLTVQGSRLASGAYFVRLEGEHFMATRRLTLVR